MEIGDLMFMGKYKGSSRAHVNNHIAWRNANNYSKCYQIRVQTTRWNSVSLIKLSKITTEGAR